MVCIYCGGPTDVVNSRHKRRQNYIWRRRLCRDCKAIFTTKEIAELTNSFMVRTSDAAKTEPFYRDRLFVSIYECCKHRPAATEDAANLTTTIINKLLTESRGATIHRNRIIVRTMEVLQLFDPTAAAIYRAYHTTS